MTETGDSGSRPDHTEESEEIIMLTNANAIGDGNRSIQGGDFVDWPRVEGARDLLFIHQPALFILLLLVSVPLSCSTSLRFSENNETLVSPGGLFEMGLFRSPTRVPGQNRWYLGIWFKKFPSKKAVWVANRDDPLSSPTAIFNISNSNLVLLDGFGVVWKRDLEDLVNKNSSVVAELLDNGNFVVRNATGLLWQSFHSPTDTILPGMILIDTSIISWKSSDDPSSGAFRYQLITSFQPGFVFLEDQVPMIRIFPIKAVPSTMNATFPAMLRIEENGVLQLLVWRGKWEVDWTSPVDVCDAYNVCGANKFCHIHLNYSCDCINEFEPSDHHSGDCVRKTQLSCLEKEFSKMTNMKLPDNGEQIDTKMGFEECKNRCLKDCTCTAFANMDTQNGSSGCIMWLNTEPLYDVRSYSDVQQGQDLHIKIAVAADSGNNMSKTTIGLIVGGASTLLLIFIVLLLFKTRKMTARTIDPTVDLTITEHWQSRVMEFELISRATDSFADSNKIGEGGFGNVYKGRLLNGLEIAVKRLISMTPDGIENFNNEVRLIGLVQHVNIIRLIGFFSDENEKILVYEHLENLGLNSYIFDTTRSSSLNWQKRFDITIGIARGLLYLHQDSRFKIIHMDLKPSNILLGCDMIPKISDFGMAKTLARDETEAIATARAGTFGYLPPEYMRDKIYSVKPDVFSFGVLLLEILSGKKNNRFPALNDGESLLSYIWSNWSEGNGLEIVDPAITSSSEFRPDQVLRCIQIGLLCVQQLAQDRPTMWLVVFMLGSETVEIDSPKSPGDTGSFSTEHLDDDTYTVCQMSMSTINAR